MKLSNLSLANALSLEVKEIEQRLEEIRNFAQNLVGKDETQNSFELSTVLKRQEKEVKIDYNNTDYNEVKEHFENMVNQFPFYPMGGSIFNYNPYKNTETNTERIGFQLSNTESLVILDFFVKKLEFERKSKLEKLKEIGVEI